MIKIKIIPFNLNHIFTLNLSKQKLVLVLISTSVLSFCFGQKPMMDEMEHWRLSYRMVWSAEFENNSPLAEKQLDSLLSVGNVIEDKILYVGIKYLEKNNKTDRIKKLLVNADSYTYSYMCSKVLFKNELKNLISCEKYYQEDQVSNPELRRKLAIMLIDDQNYRSNRMEDLIKKYNVAENEMISNDNSGRNPDIENQTKLKEIISQHGFPTKKLVGEDGMDAVFYIIQHADQDLVWQASQLSLIEKAVNLGDMKMNNYAYLYDRIKIRANLPQRWGTQCNSVKKKENLVILYTVENPENLDKRRKEAGLEPIEFYKKLMLLN